MRVCIVGGGSSAHLLAVLLAGRNHQVTILTRRPSEWSYDLELETSDGILNGRVALITNSPITAVWEAEVVILCMPVHQYPVALAWLAEGLKLNSDCMVGVVYGQGGFDWMIGECNRKCGCNIRNYFAIGLLPWIVRTQVYGKRAIFYGPKKLNGIACSNDSTFENLSKLLDDFSVSYWGMGEFVRVPNFLTLTLTVDNQIIHPSRCYALMRKTRGWKTKDEIPYFYREFDDSSAEVLMEVDADFTRVREALMSRFPEIANPLMLDYLGLEHWSYGSHNPDIKSSFVNSATLRDIKPPVINEEDGLWRLDVQHRFFKDDIAYGLDIPLWYAKQLEIEAPHIQGIVNWYEKDIVPLAGERLTPATPEKYGLTLYASVSGGVNWCKFTLSHRFYSFKTLRRNAEQGSFVFYQACA